LKEKNDHPILQLTSDEIKTYLDGDLKEFTVPIDLNYFSSSNFQIDVWKEIAKIPYGQTTTYKRISNKLNTKGFQAVGNATGSNPIPVIVGCHRVLGSDGLGGFSGGIELKKLLLGIEHKAKKRKIEDFF
jgi:O-6-methylguanine DNA methyltransferase